MALFSAWDNTDTVPRAGEQYRLTYETGIALPDTSNDFTPAMTFLKVSDKKPGIQGVTVQAQLVGSLVGTNIDVDLWGAYDDNTANAIELITTLDATTTANEFRFDLKDYNYPFLYLKVTTDDTETGTLSVHVLYF